MKINFEKKMTVRAGRGCMTIIEKRRLSCDWLVLKRTVSVHAFFFHFELNKVSLIRKKYFRMPQFLEPGLDVDRWTISLR